MRLRSEIPSLEGFYAAAQSTARYIPSAPILAAILVLLGGPGNVIADKAGDVTALEATCEAEREAKIKPLRDAEIAKCKADRHNDPGYCERYWKDYGNGMRGADGVMIPRMFGDLPDCIAAFKARKALADGER